MLSIKIIPNDKNNTPGKLADAERWVSPPRRAVYLIARDQVRQPRAPLPSLLEMWPRESTPLRRKEATS